MSISSISDFLQETYPEGLTIIDNQDRYVLCKKPLAFYKSVNSETNGHPRFYSWRSGDLVVYPYPDRAYDIDIVYLKEYPTFAADSDTNDFTDNADQMLEDYALAKVYARILHEPKMAVIHKQLEREEYLRLKKFTNDKQDDCGLTDWSV